MPGLVGCLELLCGVVPKTIRIVTRVLWKSQHELHATTRDDTLFVCWNRSLSTVPTSFLLFVFEKEFYWSLTNKSSRVKGKSIFFRVIPASFQHNSFLCGGMGYSREVQS